jgi:branched-subunit amino acid ABC-type transport system permease component
MEYVTVQLTYGLVVGTTIALTALGLTLIFGVMHIVNLSHGEFFMIGAYCAWAADQVLHNFWGSVLVAAVGSALLGGLLIMAFQRRLADAGPLRWALLTLGLGYVLREVVQLIFGTDFKLIDAPLKGTLPWIGGIYRLVVAGLSVALIVFAMWFLNRTRYGVLIRAVAGNREATAIAGVSPLAVYGWVSVISAGLAGVAGALMLPVTSAYPSMGLEIMVAAFAVVVVGGMGNIRGALVASLVAGELEALLTLVLQPNLAILLVMTLFMAVLVVRREGTLWLW